MAKKVKIGTIKLTRKVTVTQRVQVNRKISTEYESLPQPEYTQKPLEISQQALKKLETSKKKSIRPSKLPQGVYSPNVESMYEELYQRTKPEELENQAMYDVFISHASEDKRDFVDPLVDALQNSGIRVWYDSIDLQWGKSLRQQIDNGIKRSKYAILILSKHFFAKKWPQRELDGILAKEEITGTSPLPIWHDISFEEVYEFSPTLSGIYSLSTSRYSIEEICESFKLILSKQDVE